MIMVMVMITSTLIYQFFVVVTQVYILLKLESVTPPNGASLSVADTPIRARHNTIDPLSSTRSSTRRTQAFNTFRRGVKQLTSKNDEDPNSPSDNYTNNNKSAINFSESEGEDSSYRLGSFSKKNRSSPSLINVGTSSDNNNNKNNNNNTSDATSTTINNNSNDISILPVASDIFTTSTNLSKSEEEQVLLLQLQYIEQKRKLQDQQEIHILQRLHKLQCLREILEGNEKEKAGDSKNPQQSELRSLLSSNNPEAMLDSFMEKHTDPNVILSDLQLKEIGSKPIISSPTLIKSVDPLDSKLHSSEMPWLTDSTELTPQQKRDLAEKYIREKEEDQGR
eukprot:Awhi_evm1s2238